MWQKLWTIVFVILMPDIVRSINLMNSNNTKNNTVLISKIHNMELNMMYDAENIIELNTVQNTILNNTSIEHENRTQYENKVLPKKYIVSMQEMYKKERKRRMVTQAIIQGALLIVLLLILIIMGIKNDYIRIDLFCCATQYCQRMRSRIYTITANDIEPGSIWDARETYNNMLARRRTREAMRMIFYYATSQESSDDNGEFVREPQRQTV
ncbi:uncharacterized protein [Polyergus mexicanus]|uniref:uncharacterized protein n=1 Tax=Polyergus mexicanus TaxID=615972 RepID=UPI0038B49587